jgi:hypothetical protein
MSDILHHRTFIRPQSELLPDFEELYKTDQVFNDIQAYNLNLEMQQKMEIVDNGDNYQLLRVSCLGTNEDITIDLAKYNGSVGELIAMFFSAVDIKQIKTFTFAIDTTKTATYPQNFLNTPILQYINIENIPRFLFINFDE